jgi:hypothetical protein
VLVAEHPLLQFRPDRAGDERGLSVKISKWGKPAGRLAMALVKTLAGF